MKTVVFMHKSLPAQFGPVSQFLLREYDVHVCFLSETLGKAVAHGIKHITFSKTGPHICKSKLRNFKRACPNSAPRFFKTPPSSRCRFWRRAKAMFTGLAALELVARIKGVDIDIRSLVNSLALSVEEICLAELQCAAKISGFKSSVKQVELRQIPACYPIPVIELFLYPLLRGGRNGMGVS